MYGYYALNEGTAKTSCAKMEINGNVFIVIAGGYGGYYCDDERINYHTNLVEILNISKPNERWVKGPKLPFEGPLPSGTF